MTPPSPLIIPASGVFTLDAPLVACGLAATRAGAIAAASWAGRGDAHAADDAATRAIRAVLQAAPGAGRVITGEGAKDAAPMLADGERAGTGEGPEFDIAVDPLECTELCARGLPGALSTIALAPHGAMWSPGAAFYMDKLVLPPAARDAARITDPPATIVRRVADALGKRVKDVCVFVLDKPRHAEFTARLHELGARVMTPPAGDVAGALAVLLPDGGADLLLGIGGTPEGVLAACAVRALGGGMQGRPAPQRDDERRRIREAGLREDDVLELDDLIAADAAFLATGVTGGLLEAPRSAGSALVTDSLVIAEGAMRRIRQTSRPEEI
ncbi:MAG TPA: fructose-bisphosphatase class II [Solirubrobacteraceae bacterium]|nr:fructose-bisphosphatase class II [Solirubrobacteraceae bacterium]